MFLWCESGSGIVSVNGNRFRLSKDSFLILPWRHSIFYKSDKTTPFHLGGVHIIPYYAPAAPFKTTVAHNKKQIWWENNELKDVEIPYLKHSISGYFSSDTENLKRLALRAVEMYHQGRLKRATANALAVLILEEIRYSIEKTASAPRNREDNRTERIMEFIIEHLHEQIPIQQLCSVGNVSVSTLRRLFIQSVGVSPYEWILQTRLEQARYYLRTTSDSITQISLKTGFEDPSYFVRFFHRREGKTPRQYRLSAYLI